MPQTARTLSASQVKAKVAKLRKDKKAGVVNVGGVTGLLVQVTDTGAASWVLRVTVRGRVRMIGLGSYAKRSLESARDKARELHAAILDGRDPVSERQAAKRQEAAERNKAITFAQAARIYWKEVKCPEMRSDKAKQDWIGRVERHANPVIGDLPVGEVERGHILTILEGDERIGRPRIWPKPVAQSLREGLEQILEWSAVREYRQGDNPARWTTLQYALSNPNKSHETQHHAALPWQEAPAFLTDLRKVETVAAKALEFIILTAARSTEVRKASWDEIDLAGRIWTVPGKRMKGGKTHRVPLSDPAIKLLESLPHREGVLFLGGKHKPRPLYDYEVSALHLNRKVKPNGRDEWVLTDDEDGRSITTHGHRSAFKDWCRSCTSYADEVSELQLAHVNSDSTRAAYARDELLDKRSRLMSEWAKYLETGRPAKAATVTKIGAKKPA